MDGDGDLIEQASATVRTLLETEKDQPVAHRWDHLDRVKRRALRLARLIPDGEIDREVLSMAALLHDVDQPHHDKKGHVTRSLEKAEKILRDLGYPEDKRPRVLEHSSEDDTSPASLEAKVLSDADKLDGLGAVGIARVFAFCGQRGLPPTEALEWYRLKIERAIPMMLDRGGTSGWSEGSRLRQLLLCEIPGRSGSAPLISASRRRLIDRNLFHQEAPFAT